MGKIIVSRPSTFYTRQRDIVIYDMYNKPFYVNPNMEGSLNFNLPVGEFFTDNFITEKPFKPYVKYCNPNFKGVDPNSFDIIFTENKNKASINYAGKYIKIDTSHCKDFLPCVYYLFKHEIGHLINGSDIHNPNGGLIFDAELHCDKYAENWMLSHGFNPSQVELSRKTLMSKPNRKNCTHYNPITNNFKR